MKFSKKTQYGLRAMVYLSRAYKDKKRFCSLKEISEKEDISFSYLEKILLTLEKKKLIQSKKGPTGGYRLNYPVKKITIGDIVRSLESSAIVDCACKGKECSKIKTCKAFGVWRNIQKSLDDKLNSITLFSLIKKHEK